MNERMIFALWLTGFMTVAVVALAICGAWLGISAFQRTEKGAARTLSTMAQRSGLLQLLTVQVAVMSVLILRVADMLSAEATVSLLSAIAGFVLGNIKRSASDATKEEASP